MNKIQCPHCVGYKITSTKDTGRSLLIIGTFALLIGVGILIIPVGIIYLLMPTSYTCKSCGYKWKGNLPQTLQAKS